MTPERRTFEDAKPEEISTESVIERATKERDRSLQKNKELNPSFKAARFAAIMTFRLSFRKSGKTPENLGLLLAYRDIVLMDAMEREGLSEQDRRIFVTNQSICSLSGLSQPFPRPVDFHSPIVKAVMQRHVESLMNETLALDTLKIQLKAAMSLGNYEAAAAHWTAYRSLAISLIFREDGLTKEEAMLISQTMQEIY